MNFKSLFRKLFKGDPNFEPNIFYSQEGEDLILNRIFNDKNNGFYVDVGAHHPVRFSNTFFFYKKGWNGINIDAMPGSMKYFNKYRPRDINIEMGVGIEKNKSIFYQFNDPALNTFDSKEALLKQNYSYKLEKKVYLYQDRLENILDQHLPKNQIIDFLTIDVEGKDKEVLLSNNWNKYRPNYVLVETLRSNLLDLKDNEVVKFLTNIDYEIIAKLYNTSIFKKKID